MARRAKQVGGTTLTARIIILACRAKAQRLRIEEYSLSQLERESGLNHSVIHRAVQERTRKGPTLETVKRLADTLEVSLDGELEDRFFNAFGYASPRQLAAVKPYIERQELASDALDENAGS
jgi:transcriptional regulator with XRE-family HTH domain